MAKVPCARAELGKTGRKMGCNELLIGSLGVGCSLHSIKCVGENFSYSVLMPLMALEIRLAQKFCPVLEIPPALKHPLVLMPPMPPAQL